MKTWLVSWSCNDGCGVSVNTRVTTMTNRESDPSIVITMAKQKLFDDGVVDLFSEFSCLCDMRWIDSTPSIKEVSNESD
jgi:hypothetical protein